MFELSNSQRACFGLQQTDDDWVRKELPPSKYDHGSTVVWLDGCVVRKYTIVSDDSFMEYDLWQPLSDDLSKIPPKGPKGKPAPFTAAAIRKRGGNGTCLSFFNKHISLYSLGSGGNYYCSDNDDICVENIDQFRQWVEDWCADTTAEDLEDVARFASAAKQHVKYREGDVFRFRLSRRCYGYGRILMDYHKLRKQNKDCELFMGRVLACSIYRIVTPRKDLSLEELKELPCLPSCHMQDNFIFYGSYEIIGNIPLGENEDFPIIYSTPFSGPLLQRGNAIYKLSSAAEFSYIFNMAGAGFAPKAELQVLLRCIDQDSNQPYWDKYDWPKRKDLRNPKYSAQLEQICRRFGITPEQLFQQSK